MTCGKCKKVQCVFSSDRKKIDKEGNEDITTVTNKIKFIDSARFMASSLLNLAMISQMGFINLNTNTAIFFLNSKVSMTI